MYLFISNCAVAAQFMSKLVVSGLASWPGSSGPTLRHCHSVTPRRDQRDSATAFLQFGEKVSNVLGHPDIDPGNNGDKGRGNALH